MANTKNKTNALLNAVSTFAFALGMFVMTISGVQASGGNDPINPSNDNVLVVDGKEYAYGSNPTIKAGEAFEVTGNTTPDAEVTVVVTDSKGKEYRYITTADKNGNWSVNVPGKEEGDYTYRVEVTPAGADSATVSQEYSLTVVEDGDVLGASLVDTGSKVVAAGLVLGLATMGAVVLVKKYSNKQY